MSKNRSSWDSPKIDDFVRSEAAEMDTRERFREDSQRPQLEKRLRIWSKLIQWMSQ